jgi:hypothetical protein
VPHVLPPAPLALSLALSQSPRLLRRVDPAPPLLLRPCRPLLLLLPWRLRLLLLLLLLLPLLLLPRWLLLLLLLPLLP